MKRLRWILVGIGAVALACLRFFFAGRTRGKAQGAADELRAAAARDVARVEDLAAAGDDAGVQAELARATDRARGVTRPKKG